MNTITKTFFVTLLAGIALTGAARADMIAALSNATTLTTFETKTLKVGKTMPVTGVSGRLVGVDVRPADGLLYGLSEDGTVYTIDVASGRATMKVKLETMLKPGTKGLVDFNPVADRLRIIGADGTSLRANVDDGKVAVDKPLNYAAGDQGAGKAPMVTAGAYSNAFKGTQATVLYDIDTATGAFLRQVPPNDGTLNTIGMTGIKGEMAFDIVSDGQGGNRGWLVAGGALHSLDIATGKATLLGKVAGLPNGVRDIAVIGN